MSVVSFSPGPRFSFSRAYVYQIVHTTNHDIAFMVENVIISQITSVPGFIAFITLFPYWLPWSSNGYTLDHLVESAVYTPDGNPPLLDYTVAVEYILKGSPPTPSVLIRNTGGSGFTYTFPIEAAPSSYYRRVG